MTHQTQSCKISPTQLEGVSPQALLSVCLTVERSFLQNVQL
ncbi:MAG: hypothetical protein O4861_17795 [Trichodesmium sp. St16_bin4-tuft]|nr:hypothetical protein [Trichodesmium sp. St4_bin8_1]MDE5074322.1 hypothetical protein [Trichodesmium sp. St5_bin8]MDE5091927.1 hypothetical protein [Trichodesmium sp. St18_bin3_1_1]MDE5096576.1 hypothetical protein [Trichodesmium sp. St11_bin5]MDE5100083.1 hypothetical protein [Trichodesmium sp. St16_bin4-tuft]MDE5101491.1 hypothetical protein [Trichodesmium sp. St19_bin2]MDT9340897.1 hypothetical protein [Trichodesmium erythraeum 21-75]